jgi:hypothetical protein
MNHMTIHFRRVAAEPFLRFAVICTLSKYTFVIVHQCTFQSNIVPIRDKEKEQSFRLRKGRGKVWGLKLRS